MAIFRAIFLVKVITPYYGELPYSKESGLQRRIALIRFNLPWNNERTIFWVSVSKSIKNQCFFIVQAIAKSFLTSIYTHSRMSKTKVRLENQKNHTHTHFGILHNTIAICSITVLTNRQKNAWLLKTCVVFTGEGRHTKISKKIKFLLSLNFLWKIRNCQKCTKCRQLLCCNTLIFFFFLFIVKLLSNEHSLCKI